MWCRALARAGALVFLLAVSACEGEARTPQLPPLPETALVLAFGDSLTAGLGTTPENSYPAVLSGLIGRRVVRSGVSGEITASGLRRLPSVLDQYQPDLIILLHGGNDILRGLSESAIEANLRAMIAQAQAIGAEVVLVGVPRRSLFTTDGAPFYERIAEEFDLPYLETTIAEILKDDGLKSDTVHPNAAGYRKLAEDIAALMRRAGAV